MTQSTTSSGSPINRLYGAAVNNALLDPLQGFDADVWIIDQATGRQELVGRFTSIQVTIRNATEPYLEMNQRIPRYLDGEVQIGWVLERGLLDSRILQQTFGYSAMTRELRLSRHPRFQITFELNAPELNAVSDVFDTTNHVIGNGELLIGSGSNSKRQASGQLMLTFCKVDSLTLAATAGRNVIANRWEGLAEGIEHIDRSAAWAGATLQAVSNAKSALELAGRVVSNLDNKNIGRPEGLSKLNTLQSSAAFAAERGEPTP